MPYWGAKNVAFSKLTIAKSDQNIFRYYLIISWTCRLKIKNAVMQYWAIVPPQPQPQLINFVNFKTICNGISCQSGQIQSSEEKSCYFKRSARMLFNYSMATPAPVSLFHSIVHVMNCSRYRIVQSHSVIFKYTPFSEKIPFHSNGISCQSVADAKRAVSGEKLLSTNLLVSS